MTLLWLIVWAICDTIWEPENIDLMHMNGWAIALVAAVALDLAGGHAS